MLDNTQILESNPTVLVKAAALKALCESIVKYESPHNCEHLICGIEAMLGCFSDEETVPIPSADYSQLLHAGKRQLSSK